MVKVKLAFWYKDKKPGDVVEVSEDEAAQLKRDGRVAEVLGDDEVKPAKGVPSPENKKANSVSDK